MGICRGLGRGGWEVGIGNRELHGGRLTAGVGVGVWALEDL